MSGVIHRVLEKTIGFQNREISYEKWLKNHLPTEEELKEQGETVFETMPKISIVVPLYETPMEFLEELVTSVRDQTYTNWELCLSDGSPKPSPLTERLKQYEEMDRRIRIVTGKGPLKIADNTNEAIKIATGDWIAFADHDDLLTRDALFACVKEINREKKAELIYSDEDKVAMDGDRYFDPQLKPDFNLDLLRSMNYICHLLVVKTSLLKETGYLNQEFDGAQDYDLILRCVEKAGMICHIPRILYHWRCHSGSTAENQESKTYAFEAGRAAIQAHYDRCGIKAAVSMTAWLGIYKSSYEIEGNPLISVIIPNKDHVQDLHRCLTSLKEKANYPNMECIIVENNSTDPKTFQYYDSLKKKYPWITIVSYKGKFNYSAINNFGVGHAKGEYLLLLNNDTELLHEDVIKELLGCCQRPDVGGVGARLYYGDHTIQHAGVILGMGGIAGHGFKGLPGTATGYARQIVCTRDVSAVTAACLMVKKADYQKVGGFDERLKVAFNDVDFCLKIRQIGRLIVYNPYAELYHYESKSRGAEDSPEKVERFHQEIRRFEEKWKDSLKKGDPYYNTNFTLKDQEISYTLDREKRRKA